MKTPATNDPGPAAHLCAYEREAPGDLPCTNISIRRAARRLAYLYDEAAECVDLKATQVTLAGTIDQLTNMHTAQGPTLLELAGAQAIQISALTHALRPLVRDGLVALQPDAQDKRTKRATLTDEGKTRLKQALLAWSAVNHRVEQVLGPESAAMLRALADQVASDEFLQAYRDAKARQCPASTEAATGTKGAQTD